MNQDSVLLARLDSAASNADLPSDAVFAMTSSHEQSWSERDFRALLTPQMVNFHELPVAAPGRPQRSRVQVEPHVVGKAAGLLYG